LGYNENLVWAQKAVAFVKANVPFGASNKTDNWKQLWETANRRDNGKAQMSAYEDNLITNGKNLSVHASRELMIANIAATTMRMKAGNCGEQAAVAFIFLRDNNVFPIDYIEKPPGWFGLGSHAFVVIGRLSGSDPNKIEGWGPDAVVCDPHQEQKAFPAADIPRYFGVPQGYTGLRLERKSAVSFKDADVARGVVP
jgi:hypothetical protein